MRDVEKSMTSEAILRKRAPLWTRRALLSDVLLPAIACSPCSSQTSAGLPGAWLEWGMHNAGLCILCQAAQLCHELQSCTWVLQLFSHCSPQSELEHGNMRQITFQTLFYLASRVPVLMMKWKVSQFELGRYSFEACSHISGKGRGGSTPVVKSFSLCQREGFISMPEGSQLSQISLLFCCRR